MNRQAGGFEVWLPRFSLERRVTVLVLVLSLVVLGLVALQAIPLELIPRGYTNPFLRIAAPWRDAPPAEVLDKVTLPLEEELSTVRGLDRMVSFARTGYSQVFLAFKSGTDMDVAYREVRDRVERARVRMPDDLEQVFIYKDDDNRMPVAMVGLAVDPEATDVYSLIRNEILLPLERIDGVARVRVEGLEEKEILIELDRERLEASGLDVYRLAQQLARDNFALASGSVRDGSRKLLLRSVARFRTTESVAALPVAPSLRLGDIATVRYAEPEKDYRVRVNSRPAYAMMVMKEAEANALEVGGSVAARVEELKRNPRLRDFEIGMIMSQAEIIEDSLSTLFQSGRVGALLAILVLLFFLRRVRLSLVVALSIPLSIVVALVVMFFADETLNILSLLGLMLSVGLLVDNSVVVAENIHRLHRVEGMPLRQAVVAGAGEISLAITTATLTTIVVFLPVALVKGEGQFFLLRLAIPVCVSLFASLLVALVIVPLAVYLTLGGESSRHHERAAGRAMRAALGHAYERTFGLLGRVYQRLLAVFLARRLELLLGLAAIIALTQLAAHDRLQVVPMAEEEGGFFQIGVRMPRGVSFEETEAWFRKAEEAVADLKDELGLDYYILFHQRRDGQIQGALSSARPSGLTPREMIDRVLDELPEMPGIRFDTGSASESEKEGELAREVVTLYGEDWEMLDTLVDELEERFARLPGVLGIKKEGDPAPNEVALVLDRDRLQRRGIDPTAVAGMVSYALRGQALSRVYVGGRDIPVRVRFEEADRQSLDELASFVVPAQGGATASLATLVDVRQLPGATSVFRRDKRTARRITLELVEGQEKEARRAIRALRRQIDLPEGVAFGEARRDPNREELENLAFAAVLSVLFVYLLMGFLFESFLLPLAILVTIPLANLGVTWIHLLARRPLDFLGVVGMIILVGVVVNNGIVLLDYTNRLRRDGTRTLHEALMLATERRFRPIMMTALTTICGMIPLTFGGVTRIGLSYRSFGLTLIGGMAAATVLTLLVVPVAYSLIEDGRERLRRAVLTRP